MDPLILNNVTYQLFFAQADPRSRWEAAQTLLLPADGGPEMIRNLPLGECISVEILGPSPQPVLVKIDPVQLPDVPVVYQQMLFVPGQALADLPVLQKALTDRIAEHNRTQLRQQGDRPQLSIVASDLLSMAAMHPYLPCARLWEKMGRDVSPGQRKAARAELEEVKLAAFAEVRLGRVNKLLIELSDKGYALLNRPVPRRHGGGGILHRHAAHWLKWAGEKRCFKSAIEYLVPGTSHRADVAWLTPEGTEVFEICVESFDNLAGHARACFCSAATVRAMTVVTSVKSGLAEARQVLVSDEQVRQHLDRIRFEVLESFTGELEL